MRIPKLPHVIAFLLTASLVIACGETQIQNEIVHRSNCEVCHQPLNAEGVAHGLENAHAAYDVSCTACHGGTARICDGKLSNNQDGLECNGEWVYDKERAHVRPPDDVSFLKNLSATELDLVDPLYLRFINPGDLRVVDSTCGKCHQSTVDRVRNSAMAHTAGEVSVARYRAGMQDDAHAVFAAVSASDPNHEEGGACAEPSLVQMNPEPMSTILGSEAGALSVGNAQDQYIAKSCMRCHLQDFGENRFRGDYRSSGCTACHMPYAEDGRSQSADPRINKDSVPHPEKHTLTAAPSTGQCTTCHYRGARIGISYQGIREAAGAGHNPPNAQTLGRALHGHDQDFYLTDEDVRNDFDETPPDLHFAAGMDCIDCHTEREVHGDGHLYSDATCAVNTQCTDCHGTAREYAKLDAERANFYQRDGHFFLKTKREGVELEVAQVKDIVTPGHPKYSKLADISMGVHANGSSHTDEIECYTCHSGWIPACYGCHVTVDTSRDARYQTTGKMESGQPSGRRKWVTLNDLTLMRNSNGLLAPSMPAERFFLEVVDRERLDDDGSPATLLGPRPRTFTFDDGRTIPGFGQRAVNPHTTRRRSQFMACDRCHSVGSAEAPKNEVLLDITHGFGSERFPETACDYRTTEGECDVLADTLTYWLDAVMTRAGEPLVAVGQPAPGLSRVLTLAEVEAMRNVVVSADEDISTPISDDALRDPNWPPSVSVELGP